MAEKKVTGKKAASNASQTLKDGSTGKDSKKAAGSALSQTKSPKKQTSPEAAKAASKVMRDGRSSKTTKSAAGSTLSQTPSPKAKAAAKKSVPKAGTNNTGAKKRQ